MVSIWPIPEDLLFFHGFFKIIATGFGIVFLVLLGKKYRENKTKTTLGLIVTFSFQVGSTLFSSFDNLLGWDDLLGPNTWLGFGISQILLGLVGVCYFWLYLETFQVEDHWTPRQKGYFMVYG